MSAPPELGLGILLAASMQTITLQRIFNCDAREAETFKAYAMADLMSLQAQIRHARNAKPQ